MTLVSSSDDEGRVMQTPPRRELQARGSSPIHERRALRKRKRPSFAQRNGLSVLEGSRPCENLDADPSEQVATPGDHTECPQDQHGRSSAAASQKVPQDPAVAFKDALAQLPGGFGEDYFCGNGHAKLNRSLTANSLWPASLVPAVASEQPPDSERFDSWMRLLGTGLSVLVQGVGSKRHLLQKFSDEALKPSGYVRVHIHAFDARFSMCECLRGLLEQVYPDAPRQGTSAEALSAAVRASARSSGARPLCFLVHNLESLPQPHVVILSSLASSPGVHLIASTDNIWAPLAWDAQCLKDFNFCREYAHTSEGYQTEVTARHPRGLPPWSGLGHNKRRTPKASLGLVLRSLTHNHRELVQAMAERQLESDSHAGISMSSLLKISTDRMIAANVPKLRSLLNELRDHEVVVQRGCTSMVTAQVLFYLPFEDRILERLAEDPSNAIDSDDDGREVDPVNAGDEEVVA